MIQLYLNIFGLIVDLNVAIPKRKTPKNVDASDIPPTFEIQDDVEIITNEFEKEQQDMIERRR